MRWSVAVVVLAAACSDASDIPHPMGADAAAPDAAAPDASAPDADVPHAGSAVSSGVMFDRVVVGTAATGSVVITNLDATRPAVLDTIEVAVAGFSIDRSGCAAAIPAGGSCEVVVTFVPVVLGAVAGQVTVGALGATSAISLAGAGAWRLDVAPTTTGTTTSSPAGIDCGLTCSGLFIGDVTLTFTPSSPQTIGQWSVPGCAGSACSIPASVQGVSATVASAPMPPSRTVDVVISGPAPGAVVAVQGGAVVGRCQASCSMLVPSALETIVRADTPYEYSAFPVAGPGCDPPTGRCMLPAGDTAATFTSTFSYSPQDAWMFYGAAGEQFTTGAFDSANHLFASSQQRMIKLDETGQLVWTQPAATRILAGPGEEVYTWTAAGGTVKRGADGAALWTYAGELQAVDLETGNVLVHPSTTTMAVLLPTGVPLWTAAGQGTDLDAAGIVYEPYTTYDAGIPSNEYTATLHAHHYNSAGAPISDLPVRWYSEELLGPYLPGFEVSGDRIGGYMTYEAQTASNLDFGLTAPADTAIPFIKQFRRRTYVTSHIIVARMAPGPNGMIGLLTEHGYNYTYGFDLNRVARDGTVTVVSRLSSVDGEGGGIAALGLAGGATDRFAVLGWYRPVRADGVASGPDRGIIQAFNP